MIISRLATPRHVKFINTYHSSMYNRFSAEYSARRKAIDKLTTRNDHVNIFVSQTVKEDICRTISFKGKKIVLPNFASSGFHSSYQFNPGKTLRLVSVGTLRHPKNHEHSVEVMSQLTEHDITLDIYGYGPMENTVRKMIAETGARVRVITDRIVDSNILTQYDAFLMSSLQEGMSIALLEAISSGLPSVISDIPSFRETARNSALFFRLDNKRSAFNTLLHVYHNKELLKELSQNAQKLSGEFTLDNHISKLLDIYKSG
jgi:glycosyltransferase involved in cell wall biosynthesis